MTRHVEVKVMIPESRLGEFYQLLGRFLGQHSATSETFDSFDTDPRSALRQWTEERIRMWTTGGSSQEIRRRALEFYEDLAPNARRFLDFLLDQENLEAPARDICSALEIASPRTLAGMLSSFGFTAKRHGRYQPFEFRTDSQDGTVYFVPPAIASVLCDALGRRASRP